MTNDPATQSAIRQQVANQHRQIHQMLDEIQQAVSQQSCSPQKVALQLTHLRQILEAHFRSETASGMLTAVAERATWAADPVAAIIDQHGVLLEELHGIIQYAHQSTGSPSQWAQLSRQFLSFSQILADHESRETALLQRVFSEDGDVAEAP